MSLWSTHVQNIETIHSHLGFLRSGILWIIWPQQNDSVFNILQWPIEKTHQVIWDALQDHGRIEWKRNLMDLGKAPNVAYRMSLTNSIWCGGGSEALWWPGVTWLSRGWIDWIWALFLGFHSGCVGSPGLVVFWVISWNWIFSLCQKKLKIVRVEKKSPEAIPTHLRNLVAWSQILKCSLKPYVIGPQPNAISMTFYSCGVNTHDIKE